MKKRRRRSTRPQRIRIPMPEIAVMLECGCCVKFEPNPFYNEEYRDYLNKLKVFQGENI